MTHSALPAILDASIRALMLGVLVRAILGALRIRSSSARHAAWSAVLAAMLLMPVLPGLVPAIPVAAPVAIVDRPWRALDEFAAGPGPGESAPDRSMVRATREDDPAVLPGAPIASFFWLRVLVVAYFAGLGVWSIRLLLGAIALVKLRRGAIPLPHDSMRLLASSRVAVPVTAGVFMPAVILPAAWSSWSPDTLAGILAHERAHIMRRDPLVLFLACLNCCLFWFHPLAWWLRRQLSATAEQACDDAGAQAMGDGRSYAEVLVEMARTVRATGRGAWAGVGIDGSGLLRERIDRLLRSEGPQRITRTTKFLLACGCGASIVVAVACRNAAVASSLRADLEVAANLAHQRARSESFDEAAGLSREEVVALEAKIQADPGDVSSRRKLLTFYDWSGQKIFGWHTTVERKRAHALWMIEHDPGDRNSMGRPLTQAYDPVGYAAARRLWSAQMARSDTSVQALSNAAYFFQVSEKAIAEQILLRLEAEDPGGPTPRIRDGQFFRAWKDRLGRLYALGIVGSDDDTLGDVVKSVSLADAHGPFAVHARQVLDASSDPALLFAAGQCLTSNASNARVDFDHEALGRTYLERAAALDPAGHAPGVLARLRAGDEHRRQLTVLLNKAADLAGGGILRKRRAGESWTRDEWQKAKALEVQAAMAMSEPDRFIYLPLVAEEAPEAARELVRLASAFPSDPRAGNAMFVGNVMLGRDALARGDVKRAVRFTEAAGRAQALSPGVDEFIPVGAFANSLLQAGERASVADFLDRSARLLPFQREALAKAAASIRAGTMPVSYQYLVTR